MKPNQDHPKPEAQARKDIDEMLKLAGWDVNDPSQVIQEMALDLASAGLAVAEPNSPYSGHKYVDYVLMQHGKHLAVVEAKSTQKDAMLGQEQALQYAKTIQTIHGGDLPFVMYTNSQHTYFWESDFYPPRKIFGFPTRQDLEWMHQRRQSRCSLAVESINTDIAGRGYQISAIRAILEEIEAKKRKFLLIMATGTGKTRTAAALMDVLLRAHWAKRILFLVDRIALRDQTIDELISTRPMCKLCLIQSWIRRFLTIIPQNSIRGAKMQKSELLVLLGSGSSVGVIPGVEELTKRLLKWDYLREPPQERLPGKHDSDLLIEQTSDNRQPFFKALRDVIHNGSRLKDPNFEELISLCETLIPFAQYDPSKPPRTGVGAFLRFHQELQHWNASGWFQDAGDYACHQVLDWVAEANLKAIESGVASVSQGLRTLHEDTSLKVFSLNYDNLAFGSGVDFYTGFERQGRNYAEFVPRYPWPTEQDYLCQLHGSVHFGYRESPSHIVRFDDITKARETWKSYVEESDSVNGSHTFHFRDRLYVPLQDGGTALIGPMISGLRKVDKTTVGFAPYSYYINAMRNEAFRVRKWLIIGYGFGDQHINRILSEAHDYHVEKNTDHRIAIIDYHDFLDDNESVASGAPAYGAFFRVSQTGL